MLYTKQELNRAYEEIALTRKRVCTGCGTSERLSHSHLIPRSRRGDLAANPLNITLHCLDSASGPGCHSKFEGMDVVKLKDFETNFRMIYELDRQYFWLKMHKLSDHYLVKDMIIWKLIRKFMAEMDNLEHPRNGNTHTI